MLLRYSDIYDKLKGYLEVEFGDITIEKNSFFEKLANAISRVIFELIEMQRVKTEIDDNDIYKCEGEAMDRLYSQDGRTKRKAQSKAKGYWITRDSTPGTYIDVNELKLSAADDVTFTSYESVTVDNAGYAKIPIICDIYGIKGNVLANSINSITSPLIGVNTGTNEEDTNGGQDLETDAQFRSRFLITRGLYTGLSKDDIVKNLLEVSGLTGVSLIENEDETNLSIPINDESGNEIQLVMQRKSTAIWVKGGSDVDVAKAINLKRNVSIYQYGDVVVPTYSDIREVFEDIKFYRSFPKKIYYRIILEGSADLDKIRSIVKDYLNNVNIGIKLTSGDVEKTLYRTIDTSFLDNVEIEYSYDGTIFTNSLQLRIDEHVGTIEEVTL